MPIRCTALREDRWTRTHTLVDGEDDYAAWVLDVSTAPQGPGFYNMRWVRDSTFQFLNLSNDGRPPSDGVYQTTLELLPHEGLVARSTVKLSDSVVSVTAGSGS